jgi:biofilm PGA synthesis protein PgaA
MCCDREPLESRTMHPRRLLPTLLLLTGLNAHSTAVDPAADGDWAVLLGQQLAVLDWQPDDPAARRTAWRAAMRLGLYQQAAALAAPLTGDEQRAMEGDRIALAIRYGIIDRNTLRGPARFVRLDQALTASDTLAAEFFAGRTPDAEELRRLSDRLSALAARRRAADAVELYETLLQRELPVPLWARKAVAGSYLERRRPQPAVELYKQVVTASPDDFDANLGLFYALVENEELDAASAHIDRFAGRLPERRHLDGKYNGERLSADITADQARTYADRLQAAEQRISARRSAIPYNSEARQAAASLYLARGWPQLGQQMLRRTLGSDPLNPALHADLAETLLTLQDWPAARASLDDAERLDRDSSGARRARETLALHDRHELHVESGYGQGKDNGFLGNRDWVVDSFLYSRPLAERWRVFAHNYSSTADFDGSLGRWLRSGVGAEWRWLNWRLTGEINGGSNTKPGLTASARWKPDDHWTLYGTAESVTNQIALRAVADGVEASRVSVGADWRAHESRNFALALAASDFSDNNRRTAVNAAWFERWYSGPRWMFETTLGADASHNTLSSPVSYFNPANDHSLWLTAAIENLSWRHYDYSFRQRLALTGGRYWQADYAAGAIEAIEYTHRWELDRNLSLRYGIGRSLRPYDGVSEGRTFGTLVMLWRF